MRQSDGFEPGLRQSCYSLELLGSFTRRERKGAGGGGGRSDPPRLGGGELKSLVETAGTLPSHVSQSHESLQG